ncbi:efflux RND transporter periplasmic adaptor subunit [Pasteurella canis]|uniref:multidrug efflux RND transporter periplasmic adaptor subunit AcrA n=1 Tax=Pasteurella canis TaxID=753 RepID=UPI0006661BEB|nr:efflux RND transporter periplasmic adaptor subunit [Pasteurella canis]UAX42239.1 efflux RND transporter periplasmic adaptor subunit [Pasteurella canis]UAY77792.1 efflux RND transporter periplasmic adaptor subunit [Pasteurella canis]SPY33768.1 putative RND efflux membrane fusion protein [Pasteurella canis]
MSGAQANQPKRSHSVIMKITLGLIVLLFIVVIAFNVIKNKMIEKAIAGMGEKAYPVTAIEIQPQQWTPVIETTGLVRPNQGAMLSAQIAGTVSKVLVQSGQSVKKGDILVILDSSVEQASLKASQAQLSSIKATYQRYLNLYKTKSVSQQELDNAKSAYEALEANIAALKAGIERRQIIAPFDGKAGIVKVNVGQYVNPGMEIVRVEDTSSMKIDFALSQTQLEHLYIGQKVTATADARTGETFAAKITAVEPAISSSTGLIDVQATFEPEDGRKLLSGMFTRLRVALPTEYDQVVVPQVAVSYNMYGEIAYVLVPLSQEERETLANRKDFDSNNLDKAYRAKQITVFTKDRQGVYAQLKGDEVKVGDKIVTGGQQNLSNGSLVLVADKTGVGTMQPAQKNNL